MTHTSTEPENEWLIMACPREYPRDVRRVGHAYSQAEAIRVLEQRKRDAGVEWVVWMEVPLVEADPT